MQPDTQAAIIANDLDSLAHRIEALPAHPEYTRALNCVQMAKEKVTSGRMDLHHKGMASRFALQDAG